MQKYTFPSVPGSWQLQFKVSSGGDGELLRVSGPGGAVLSIVRSGGLRVTLNTRWAENTHRFGDCPSFTFALETDKTCGDLRVVWLGYSLRLYVDGALEDEDWPLGEPVPGPWTAEASPDVRDLCLAAPDDLPPEADAPLEGPVQYYAHPGRNTGVGDCMPFARDGRWCLYYLLDRRGHRSKQGLGAHQWAQISTPDLRRWTLHPMAVPISQPWEGSICTGSLIEKDGLIYAFYAARMSDGSPARLTWAVSPDGVRFEKSGQYVTLTEPYEPVSARDPKVFLGEDGRYHMLVTTSLAEAGRYGGCLAHLTSGDLLTWTQEAPFILPGYADQPECSDYFYWNGWYYLVFSNFAVGRYRMSRQPFGPWQRPEYDLLDALEVQVPKTAAFGERRLSAGFLARRPRAYAGTGVIHELFQRPDGTLGVKQAEELLPVPASQADLPPISLSAPQGRASQTLGSAPGGLRLKAALRWQGQGARFGLALCLSGGEDGKEHEYTLEFDPGAGTARLIRPGEDFTLGAVRETLSGLDLSGGLDLDLIVTGDIFDLITSAGRAMTLRLDRAARGAALDAFVLDGSLDMSQISLSSY